MTATECTILRPSEKKNRFFHGFIILYLKFWLHRFCIQNAAECSILRPSELEKKYPPLPLLVSRGLACMRSHIIWLCPQNIIEISHWKKLQSKYVVKNARSVATHFVWQTFFHWISRVCQIRNILKIYTPES
jgi:hypothetical protein